MRLFEASKLYSLNKFTYINLRWIAYIGQISAILIVQFVLQFKFNYFACFLILFFGILTNLYLQFKITQNQLNSLIATIFLAYDILQLGFLLYLTGGITNPFIVLLIIPSVFSSQHLKVKSSIILVVLTILILIILTFFIKIYPCQKNFIFMHQNIIYIVFHYRYL